MHQEHTIPWNTLASHLDFIRDNPHVTPCRTDLFPRNRPTQTKEFTHFAKVLAKTISTFSQTERSKYPPVSESPSSGKIFSDELRDRYPEHLDRRYQHIQNWFTDGQDFSYSLYHPAHAVKVLINENEMTSLLTLAQHPRISLLRFRDSCADHYRGGFSCVARNALDIYLIFNVAAAKGILENGEYKEMRGAQWSIADCVGCRPGSPHDEAEQLPYKSFFNWPPDQASQGWSPDQTINALNAHGDLGRLHDLLKLAFRLLYRYDLVHRECGEAPDWESLITERMVLLWAVKSEISRVGERKWIRRFV
ncbi:hypothetical protein BV22DRAFT_577422 [Leucogyrophana mollusca]|uniref:Uncharacterized protein n=1 Tax=Leucogyrophana mollusca TaxID=85980 RepID=A0ACB8BE10_9AGAM|nr:hypothetical protein BV22DRAFT_577422 [Leucogyrophana mollusca]